MMRNKYIKRFIFFLIGLFVISCENKPKLESKSEFSSHQISFFNAEIQLPKEFKKITADELVDKFTLLDENLTSEASFYKSMELMPYECLILYDTSNFLNTISFMEFEHIAIDKLSAQFYLGMIENDLTKSLQNTGAEFERLKSKYTNNKDLQMVSITYKISKKGLSKYISQYIISTQKKTMMVNINNQSNIDFSDIIKNMKIKF